MDRITEERILRDLENRLDVFSGTIFEHILRFIHVHILEVEDVLFHLNSAVMMPARPSGDSSSDGTEDDATDTNDTIIQERQDQITGLEVLGVALRQFEFDPNKRLLIAGHTDTSGEAEMNFELSDLRAKNVLYLLDGDRAEWARVSEGRHRVEDYQQIMTWVSQNPRFGWPCDPVGIDNSWGDRTRGATQRFAEHYNANLGVRPALPPIPPPPPVGDPPPNPYAPLPANLHERVQADAHKKWPREAWAAVYDLYIDELTHMLGTTPGGLVSFRSRRLRFVDTVNRFVGCGESFPVDDADRDNYRSQLNRRVELLFFDACEVPNLDTPEIGCPVQRTVVHTRDECPLYNKCHYIPGYIDSDDLTCVPYHMKFAYFNKVLGRREYVPSGLEIQAYEDGDSPAGTRWQFSNGVHTVKVQDNPARTTLYFEFNAVNKWIYTSAPAARPRIVTKTDAEMAALTPQERYKYYDLPARWSSRNYWTRGDGASFTNGNRFETVMGTDRQLKPYGNNTTSYELPLVFSLDDIVLLDTVGGTQDVEDFDHLRNTKNLSNRSRVKLFIVDSATGFLTLHKTGVDANTARIPFSRNLILEDVNDVKIVFFRDGFYSVANKRTQPEPNWVTDRYVVGARAAVRDDSDHHVSWEMRHNDHEFGSTGDHDLHYFHNMFMDGQNPVSFLIYYVGISFMADSRPAGTANPVPTVAEVRLFVDEGVYNSMDEWNTKRYYLEESTATATTAVIRPFYFFDERETFLVTAPTGGFVNCNFDNRPSPTEPSNHKILFDHAALNTAKQNAVGGKSKFLAMVCKNTDGHWGPAYQWSIRNEGGANYYSLLKLNKSSYKPYDSTWGGPTVNEHGHNYYWFTMAHELGHATGQPDEYQRTKYKPYSTCNRAYVNFKQHYLPYSMNTNRLSMMFSNLAPRLRYMWYGMHQINKDGATAGSDLHSVMPNKTFVARLHRGTWNITYTRNLTTGNPNVPHNRDRLLHRDQHFNVTTAPRRRQVSLELYDVGKDESSIKYFHTAQGAMQYQGVLVVRVLMKLTFPNAGGNNWTNAQRRARALGIVQAFKAWGGHYRLTGGAKDLTNIYIHFLPGFYSTDDSDTEGMKHYDLDVRRTPESVISCDATDTWKIQIGRNVTDQNLVYYFFNRTAGQSGTTALNFLKTWVDTEMTDSYNLQSFGTAP